MLKLRDFNYLEQLNAYFDQIIADGSGMIVIAGIESRSIGALANSLTDPLPGEVFLPSGLSGLFDILMQTMLLSDESGRSEAVVVAREKSLARVPRQLKRRIRLLPVEGGQSYTRQVENAVAFSPALLVIDHLTFESAPAALAAAHQGIKVLASVDSVLCGAALARHLLGMGVDPAHLEALSWVLSLQRLPALCPNCRQEIPSDARVYERLYRRYPALKQAHRHDRPARFWRAGSCEHCHHTGRKGDVAVFDVFCAREARDLAEPGDSLSFLESPSQYPLEAYACELANQGVLSLDDLLWLHNDQLRRTYTLLSASGIALTEATSTLQRKLFELEASNRVLVQRTEVLMSLEDLGQALIESVGLRDLARRVCRRAGDLCGADRVILYLLREDAEGMHLAEVLASRGWDEAVVDSELDASLVFEPAAAQKITRFVNTPPGVHMPKSPSEGHERASAVQSGLRVPLMAQDRLVGGMIIQSTQKGFFTPGETALLQTFANQAALAIQRAGLVDELRAKILELEAAQVELVKKERMERELELARQVQQSLLPAEFPDLPGFHIAARNQAARQVGGDFYDVIVLDDDHFGIVVADVSDKGMPAALYMGLTRALLLAEGHRSLSPKAALENVNRLLLELGDLNGFVSVFYAVIEMSTRVMRYTRAGHERPWLLRASDEGFILHQLPGSGMVLGIVTTAGLGLTEELLALAPGDTLVMYTDGICDATDSDGNFFGGERLRVLLASLAGQPAHKICEGVFHALAEYRGQSDPFDDMTLMVLGVNPPD